MLLILTRHVISLIFVLSGVVLCKAASSATITSSSDPQIISCRDGASCTSTAGAAVLKVFPLLSKEFRFVPKTELESIGSDGVGKEEEEVIEEYPRPQHRKLRPLKSSMKKQPQPNETSQTSAAASIIPRRNSRGDLQVHWFDHESSRHSTLPTSGYSPIPKRSSSQSSGDFPVIIRNGSPHPKEIKRQWKQRQKEQSRKNRGKNGRTGLLSDVPEDRELNANELQTAPLFSSSDRQKHQQQQQHRSTHSGSSPSLTSPSQTFKQPKPRAIDTAQQESQEEITARTLKTYKLDIGYDLWSVWLSPTQQQHRNLAALSGFYDKVVQPLRKLKLPGWLVSIAESGDRNLLETHARLYPHRNQLVLNQLQLASESSSSSADYPATYLQSISTPSTGYETDQSLTVSSLVDVAKEELQSRISVSIHGFSQRSSDRINQAIRDAFLLAKRTLDKVSLTSAEDSGGDKKLTGWLRDRVGTTTLQLVDTSLSSLFAFQPRSTAATPNSNDAYSPPIAQITVVSSRKRTWRPHFKMFPYASTFIQSRSFLFNRFYSRRMRAMWILKTLVDLGVGRIKVAAPVDFSEDVWRMKGAWRSVLSFSDLRNNLYFAQQRRKGSEKKSDGGSGETVVYFDHKELSFKQHHQQ